MQSSAEAQGMISGHRAETCLPVFGGLPYVREPSSLTSEDEAFQLSSKLGRAWLQARHQEADYLERILLHRIVLQDLFDLRDHVWR